MKAPSSNSAQLRPLSGGWIKFRREIINRREYAALSDHHWRFIVSCNLVTEDGTLPPTEEISFLLRLSVEQSQESVEELVKKGLLQSGKSGISLPFYSEEQARDSVAERVARHRERKMKHGGNDDETKSSQNKKKNKKENKEEEQNEKKNPPIVPDGDGREEMVMKRLRGLFHMRESTPLDKTDRNAWKASKQIALSAPEEEWELLEWHHSQPSGENEPGSFCKRSISSLLSGWNKAIANARRAREQSERDQQQDEHDDWADYPRS